MLGDIALCGTVSHNVQQGGHYRAHLIARTDRTKLDNEGTKALGFVIFFDYHFITSPKGAFSAPSLTQSTG